MGEPEKELFRFLSEDEFFNLEPEGKVSYLLRAQKELEMRQRMVMKQSKTDDSKEPK